MLGVVFCFGPFGGRLTAEIWELRPYDVGLRIVIDRELPQLTRNSDALTRRVSARLSDTMGSAWRVRSARTTTASSQNQAAHLTRRPPELKEEDAFFEDAGDKLFFVAVARSLESRGDLQVVCREWDRITGNWSEAAISRAVGSLTLSSVVAGTVMESFRPHAKIKAQGKDGQWLVRARASRLDYQYARWEPLRAKAVTAIYRLAGRAEQRAAIAGSFMVVNSSQPGDRVCRLYSPYGKLGDQLRNRSHEWLLLQVAARRRQTQVTVRYRDQQPIVAAKIVLYDVASARLLGQATTDKFGRADLPRQDLLAHCQVQLSDQPVHRQLMLSGWRDTVTIEVAADAAIASLAAELSALSSEVRQAEAERSVALSRVAANKENVQQAHALRLKALSEKLKQFGAGLDNDSPLQSAYDRLLKSVTP